MDEELGEDPEPVSVQFRFRSRSGTHAAVGSARDDDSDPALCDLVANLSDLIVLALSAKAGERHSGTAATHAS
jgi:hypothetical protein